MDTAELIRTMRERESDALAWFQTAYTPLIRYIISPILPDESDREECLSDMLLRAWEFIGSYDPQKAAFSTWLAILARNAALNRRRDDARRQGHGALDDSIPDPAGTPEEALLQRVFRKAGQEPGTGAAGAVVACYTLIVLLALCNTRVQIQGLLAWLALLLWLVLLTRLSNRKTALLALLSLAAAVAACLLLFSRYPVHGTPAQAGTGQAELRAELAELGFPEDLLADLTDGEAAQLEGATEVSCGITKQGALTSAFVYQGALTVTFIQVSLPDGMARYFYFFSCAEPPDTRLTDGIRVAPMWRELPYFRPSAPQGRLLWEEDGQGLQCPLVSDGPFIAAPGMSRGRRSLTTYSPPFPRSPSGR